MKSGSGKVVRTTNLDGSPVEPRSAEAHKSRLRAILEAARLRGALISMSDVMGYITDLDEPERRLGEQIVHVPRTRDSLKIPRVVSGDRSVVQPGFAREMLEGLTAADVTLTEADITEIFGENL